VAGIVREVFQELAVPGMDLDALLARIPADY
jgi:hypothetical protein